MRRLRQKIEPDPDNPIHLVTIRGIGYRLVARPAATEA
jgi:DNA-binding response OmpR family regulator